ncbi:MAG TPA: amidophosphoribosyltransferase [Saprospiraceae bacterium]|jgi:amidophosphoribosyltransferase|nr:amidophosphoribosyltransferase [Saprospiraceae bacterium]MBK7698441.1 amidophosphoribosyltransferase [Saprospiraceae bacterium]HQV96260.1 amidophosphoribosyltransferase [Saprospiraceae bacterium]HRG39794.1 amidophosphoribosyltransferase [Saprospiraceae bacterium]
MSDSIKHECGLALIRLLKPLDYYHKKYGTALYGLNKMNLLLQKQRNRGQDGAGLVTIKLDTPPGTRFISRKRSNSPQYLKDLFDNIFANFQDLSKEQFNDPQWLKDNKPYIGELLLGHLRYGTHGANTIETVHPFLRQNNWITRNLVLAGNFNLTNVDELFAELLSFGQYPKEKSDTVTVLEKIGHFLDDEVQRLFNWFKSQGFTNLEINNMIADHLDIQRLLLRASRKFDGGYVMAGLIGHGDAFVFRDPAGIRPAFYYQDDEIVVVASERPAIQTSLNIRFNQVKELQPGHALIIKKNGLVSEELVKEPTKPTPCSFERIYFSRGTDRDIYLERKKLGELLADKILKAVNYDIENTIFSFIPNTAEVAFFGMIKGLEAKLNDIKSKKILELSQQGLLTDEALANVLSLAVRAEKLAVKDEKLRTFIADDASRNQMVSHVYDVTYGIVRNEVDTLVLIDDSIVRGTTLKESIIYILSTLRPKKIIIVSSAPQIRYPDCYGIDMSKMKEFVAFRALVELLEEDGKSGLLDDVLKRCIEEENKPVHEMQNQVQSLYAHYTDEQISAKISQLVTPENIAPEVQVLYQSIEDLHKACPNHNGDWYFSGNYPTPGGMRVVNRAFINYMRNNDERAY